MKGHKTSRAHHALRIAFVVAMIILAPLFAKGQDAATAPAAAPVLTPPSLLPGSAPALPELPVGSEPTQVVLELTVDKDGSARDAVVIASGGSALDQAALEAVSALRFQPATRDGLPIVARIPFRFTFQPAAAPPPPPPPPAAPAEPAESEGLTLDVQGEKPPREPTVYTIEIKEAQKLPGTNGDPMRAIESLPGVARPPGLTGQLVVRGSGPDDNGYFIDGVQIPLSYHFGGISSVVPNDVLSRLDFRPGNFGAEYGRAMGGVVDFGLRAPRRDRIGGLVQLDVIDGRFMVEGPLGPRTRFLLAGRRSWMDAWVGKVSDAITAAPVYYDGQAILEHDLTSRTTAQLVFFGADDRMKLLVDAPSASDPSEGGALKLATAFTRLALRFDSHLTDKLVLKQVYAWGIDKFIFNEGSEMQDIKAHQLSARIELRANLTQWMTGVVGVDTQVAKYHVKLHTRPYPATDEVDGPAFARPFRTMDETVWMARPAVYALLELTPFEGLRIVPGVRGDYAFDTEQFVVDPRITARWDVHHAFPRTTLKTGVGSYTQPPMGVESIEPFGTKGVTSNRSLQASLGVEQELARGLELSIEGFYKHLTNLVVSVTAEDTEGLGAHFQNTGDGRAYGGELMLKYNDPRGRYFGWVAYTLSRSERRRAKDQDFQLFDYDQTHILTVLGNFELGRGFSAGARFRYVTGSPYTPIVAGVLDLDAGSYAPISGDAFSTRLPSFNQLDLRVDKTWLLGPTKLIAYLEVRNAYNRKNTEQINYRYDYAESAQQQGLPIMPVIGLRGEL